MAPNSVFVFFFSSFVAIASLATPASSSRDFPGPGPDGPALDCFSAISEIRSCSNEIAAYFANGTVDISPPCCDAIAVITHRCWPDVLGVFGLGPGQADVLRGYCDASAADSVASYDVFGPGPSPVGQPLLELMN